MTDAQKAPPEVPGNDRASSTQPMLTFNPQDLIAMRVKPAQFARMCMVSKQAVSDWIKKGVITLGPDGLLDPVVASRHVLDRTDPARIRARVFKDLARDLPELREQNRELRDQVKALTAEREALATEIADVRRLWWHPDDIAERMSDLLAAIEAALPDLADDSGAAVALDYLASKHFRRFDADELQETFGDYGQASSFLAFELAATLDFPHRLEDR